MGICYGDGGGSGGDIISGELVDLLFNLGVFTKPAVLDLASGFIFWFYTGKID